MNKKMLKRRLAQALAPQAAGEETGLERVKAAARAGWQCGVARRRIGFWAFLAQTARFYSLRLWGMQALAILAVCGVVQQMTAETSLRLTPALMPLLVLACVPELSRSETCGMAELERATRASTLQLILAKLVLAGTADLAGIAVVAAAVWPTWRAAGAVWVHLALYLVTPILAASAAALWSLRRHGSRAACLGACGAVSLLAYGAMLGLRPVYEASAIGVWLVALAAAAAYFSWELIEFVRWARRPLSAG